MNFRPARAAAVSIGTALLLLTGIRCAQAQEIKIVSPGAYEDIEGEGSIDENCCVPYRYQQVFPAADFAALGAQPHWIVDFTYRPDESQTNSVTSHWPDHEVRLSTTQTGPDNLSWNFDENLGADVMQFYRGPQTAVAVAGSGPGPREFYNIDRPAGVTPFLYDPSQGNLLFESIARQGVVAPSGPQDKVLGISGLVAFSPFATVGALDAASIFQFTFIPVLPGDFNGDTIVDAVDLAQWKGDFGVDGSSDADDDGDSDGADLLIWQRQLGAGELPAAEVNPVPEPAAVQLIVVVALLSGVRLRRRSRNGEALRLPGTGVRRALSHGAASSGAGESADRVKGAARRGGRPG